MKLFREPLLHFLLIGAAFFLFYNLFSNLGPDQSSKTIVVGADEIEWMKASWQQRWNRPPLPRELDSMIQDYIRETVLYREALALGLDKDDRFIRQRLSLKMEFLAADLATLTPPSEDALTAYFEAHRERYLDSPRYTFSQLYFDPGKRGDTAMWDAEATKRRLDAGEVADPASLGDRLMLGSDFTGKDQIEIQKLFGPEFAASLAGLEPGQWYGPLLSGYGVHLVYVSRVDVPPDPDIAAIRDKLLQDWTSDKGEELKKEFYAGLRDQYTIIIEQPADVNGVAVSPASSE